MKARTFTIEDQRAFAALSGDCNPVHLDPIAARRTMFGRVVVHGVHAALWALDAALEGQTEPRALAGLKATFQGAIGVGDLVRCVVEPLPGDRAEIEVRLGDSPAVWMAVSWGPVESPPPQVPPARSAAPSVCRSRAFGDLADAAGSLVLSLDSVSATALFPTLARLLAPIRVAEILATSRLVGMECPGLHSVLSGLDLGFSAEPGPAATMDWSVRGADERLSLVPIQVTGPGLRGTIKALLRPTPRAQAAFAELGAHVRKGEFADQRALVLGGSRGLGEVVAKLLAAGGASVKLTYHRGSEDARRIVEEIARGGGVSACFPCDVLAPSTDPRQDWGHGWSPTHLYYFATPHISAGRAGCFSPELFREFCEAYVLGLMDTLRAVRSAAPGLRALFYPSSVYVEDPPPHLAEYAAAKAVGEIAARVLERTWPGLTVRAPRLPRLATDQTVSLLPVTNLDPVPILLGHLRDLRDSSTALRPPDGR